jgi:transmembrane sensor
MNKELLEKYCNNSCTEQELLTVLKWFEESSRSSEGKAMLFRIWEELSDEDGSLKVDFDYILDNIHHKVNLAQSKKNLEEANQNLRVHRKKENILKILTRVAAILLLPVVGFGLYMSLKYWSVYSDQTSVNQAYNEVYSSVDAITKVTLPDGSNVWLNHRSSLQYPVSFRGKYRTVELKGEGYFEVVHNSKIPFIVRAGEIEIKATGTTFNIMAFPEDGKIETSLISGQVELQVTKPGGKSIPALKMKPAELAIYQTVDGEIKVRTIPDDRYFIWKDGKLVFNKEPMGEVVKKLSRWFNVEIQIKDPELFDLTYTATFEDETFPQVMELISMVSPVSYSISNRQRDITTGGFTKRKCILSYRKK